MVAKAAKHDGPHPRRMQKCGICSYSGTHGIAHHISPLDSQMSQQSDGVASHKRGVVILGIVEFLALAMAPVIKQNNAPPRRSQGFNPERVHPVDRIIGRKTMNQKHGQTHGLTCGGLILIGEADAGMIEKLHRALANPVGAL